MQSACYEPDLILVLGRKGREGRAAEGTLGTAGGQRKHARMERGTKPSEREEGSKGA